MDRQDENGCLVLKNARAMASASCGGGAFNSFSDSDATTKVLGFCGLLPPGFFDGFNYSGGDSGSTSWDGGLRRLMSAGGAGGGADALRPAA